MSQTRRIVVADDSLDALTILRLFLEAVGYEVIAVADGEAAIRAIETHQPLAALIDINLPLKNGLEVAQAIRANANLAAVQLIACTGHGGRDRERASLEGGFDRHLTKPIDLRELEQILPK